MIDDIIADIADIIGDITDILPIILSFKVIKIRQFNNERMFKII